MGRMRREIDVKENAKLGDSVHDQALSIQTIVRSCNL